MNKIPNVPDNIALWDDGSGRVFIEIIDAAQLPSSQLRALGDWCTADRRHVLGLLDCYRHSRRYWEAQFASDLDLELVIASDIAPEHAKRTAQEALKGSWEPSGQPRVKTPKQKFPGYVYLIQSGDYYKIGLSAKVNQRLEKLAVLPPFKLELIHTIKTKDMYALEHSLHKHFAEKRMRGEWFELDDADVALLKSIEYAKEALSEEDIALIKTEMTTNE